MRKNDSFRFSFNKKPLSFGRSLEILRGFFQLGFFAEAPGITDYTVEPVTYSDGILEPCFDTEVSFVQTKPATAAVVAQFGDITNLPSFLLEAFAMTSNGALKVAGHESYHDSMVAVKVSTNRRVHDERDVAEVRFADCFHVCKPLRAGLPVEDTTTTFCSVELQGDSKHVEPFVFPDNDVMVLFKATVHGLSPWFKPSKSGSTIPDPL